MQKVLGFVLLVMGASVSAMALVTPEINPASAGSALALVSGALLIYRGRR